MHAVWTLRLRVDQDVAALVPVLRDVHHRDGYPTHWPSDPVTWLTPRGLVAAWVARDNTGSVGHVALTEVEPQRSTTEMWARATGVEPALLRCVTRLFVASAARGTGIGGALLDAAATLTESGGGRAVLEVASCDTGAVDLYRRRRWREVGQLKRTVSSGAGTSLLFVAPASARR